MAKLWLAWQRRFETVILQEEHLRFGQAIVQDERRLRQPILTHNVVCIDDRSGRKQEYRIGKARRGGSEQASTLGAIKATYLSSFLDEVLPAYQHVGLTYLNLWQAWWVLQEIANVHQARMPSRGMLTWKHVDSYALRFSVSRATKAIASALGLPPSSAEAVMEIFTTDPNLMDSKNANDLFQQNTWGRPIVRSPNEDRGRIVLASLRSPNPVMTMERWMMRTGMTDDSGKGYKKTERGRVFERVVRERLEAVRVTSECLRGFRVAQLSARGDGAEQIDLLLQFGSTIAVCEVKCFNVPFSPLDRYNHLRKIKGAVSQANRKAEWARGNPTSILSALSVPKGERDRPWRFVPLVVLNTAYGAGLTLDGCAVTDVDWLSTFLGSPKISVSGLFERGRRASMEIRTVYRDQADLERRFAEVAVSPPSLASELDRIEWELIPFPTSSGEALLLRVPVSTGIPGMSPPQ
ncbi:hypothetical protein CKO32_17005 [Afifella marina DSM 2698]|nr:hypothetical protein [Afifella marina DSM 2698]MBK1628978.1 hypothetical protein [Afifella marina]MBK5918357.1 hypothetical protein [Afifella marina]